jgi:hypothetical protein
VCSSDLAELPTKGLVALLNDKDGDYPVSELQYETVSWDPYPAVKEVLCGKETFFAKPDAFFFKPVSLERPFSEAKKGEPAFLFPNFESLAGLSRRSCVMAAYKMTRSSEEFPDALEEVELSGGIPIGAAEYAIKDGEKLSETDFRRGKPVREKVDLDMDGRMETVRVFPAAMLKTPVLSDIVTLLNWPRVFQYAESDWNGDGIYEAVSGQVPRS